MAFYFIYSDKSEEKLGARSSTAVREPVDARSAPMSSSGRPLNPSSQIASDGAKAFHRSIADDFSRIVDGHRFVIDEWNHPEIGGQFYGSQVADKCSFVKQFTAHLSEAQPEPDDVGHSHYLAALDALRRLQARCGQFTDDELLQFSGNNLLTDQARKDRLMKSVLDFNDAAKSRDAAARDQSLAEIIREKDPLVIDQLGSRILLRPGNGTFSFDDISVQAKDPENILIAAMYLAPCSLGLPCDANDADLMIGCVSGSGCYVSRHEKIQATLAQGDEAKMAQIDALASRIASAIEADDVQKFTSRH
jgi:hypothetical protein